jgi:hypothetical protein
MLEIDNSRFFFKTKTIWFSEVPFDIDGFDGVLFQGCSKNVNLVGFTKQEFTTLVIDLNQDLDRIWQNFGKSSSRYSINKAKKVGVRVIMNQEYDTFFDMNSKFRKAKGLPKFNLDIEFMKKNGLLFLSEFEGEILGGQFYLTDGKNIRWLLNASKRFEKAGKIRILIGQANRLMVWEAINYAKVHGIHTFDMGGYNTDKMPDPQKEGVNRFKKSFGGQMMTQYIYQKDYSNFYHSFKKMHSIKQLFIGVIFMSILLNSL